MRGPAIVASVLGADYAGLREFLERLVAPPSLS
jgi:hypothetical protein